MSQEIFWKFKSLGSRSNRERECSGNPNHSQQRITVRVVQGKQRVLRKPESLTAKSDSEGRRERNPNHSEIKWEVERESVWETRITRTLNGIVQLTIYNTLSTAYIFSMALCTVYALVTPLIPKSSAMIMAAFSPIARAVLYVLAPTLAGVMLQSGSYINYMPPIKT